MENKSEIVTSDITKTQKRRFEDIENEINESMVAELIGELGAKYCVILKKELQEARKMALDYLNQFHKNMETIEKMYDSIAALEEVFIDENSSFIFIMMEIEQDEIKENELKNQIIQADIKHKELQSLIASKKAKYHDAYDRKLL
jgi:hypothetical protein